MNIMDQEMTRKKFLTWIGAGLLAIPFISKNTLASVFWREDDGNSLKLLTKDDALLLDQTTPQEIINGTPNFALGATGNVSIVGNAVGYSATVDGGDGSNTGSAYGVYGDAYCGDSSPAYGVYGNTRGSAVGAGGYFTGFSRSVKLAGDGYALDMNGGFYWADYSSATNAFLSVSYGVVTATEQSSIYISGFYNDSGYITYYDTISYAESSGYAYSSDYAWNSTYADSANYAGDSTYWSGHAYPADPYDGQTGYFLANDSYGNLSWQIVAGDTTFTQWRDGTAFSPTGSCEFNDEGSKYARYWDAPNGNIASFSDGTYTFNIGQSGSISYIAGASDFHAELDGAFVSNIEAGTMIPSKMLVIRDSTDSILTIQELCRHTTGTAADGLGFSQDLYIENEISENVMMGQIIMTATDVSDGSEESSYVVKIMDAGTLTEHFKIDSNGITTTAIESTGDISVAAQPRVTTTGFTTSTANAGVSSGGAIAVYNDGVTSGQLTSITIEEGIITAYTVIP